MNKGRQLGSGFELRRKCAVAVFLCAVVLAPRSPAQSAQPPTQQQQDPHAGHRMPATEERKESTAPPVHDHSQMNRHEGMAGMSDMPGMSHASPMNPSSINKAGLYLMNMASGTSMSPASWTMPMLMPRAGSWSMMIMGQAFLGDTQQSGPRGGDKFYSANWFMGSAVHSLGAGSVMFQTMLSLEPATVTNRRYPLLFQTGETAYGKPLTDAQHPHDFVMGLGVHYARPVGSETILQLYYAPVGDPALGPVAFPHRASAAELPQATLGHHWQDSTHIAANVATVALKHKWLRVEASGFHGTEPDENRWNIDWGPMNSYAGRISVFPSKNWMAQVSAGRIAKPERLEEGDVVRMTASLHYTRPIASRGDWSTSLVWGRNHDTARRRDLNSYLLETLYPINRKNLLTARVELVDKNELFADRSEIEERLARTAGDTFRVQAWTGGYTRNIGAFRNVEAGLGANVTSYAIPSALKPYYGEHPWGANVFLRLRLKQGE
jgi:hypothetical protein